MYIVFEGIVGSGKTTQAKKLYEYLKERYSNKEIILTREPGGSEIAEDIRKIVQANNYSEEMDPVCEAYLYAASRAQTLRKIVKPVLDRGGIVIADRSYISSAAYQGKARGLGIPTILNINQTAIKDLMPNLIIYIEINTKLGLSRTFDHEGDKFENENSKFFERVKEGYREISKSFGDKWISVDGSAGIEDVFDKIIEKIKGILPAS